MFIGNNDKINSLATIILYVYRSKLISHEYDKELMISLTDMVKSKNTDILSLKDILKTMLGDENNINKTNLIDTINLTLPEDNLIAKKLIKLLETDLSEEEMKKYISEMDILLVESNNLMKSNTIVNLASFNINTKEMSVKENIALLKKVKEELSVLDNINENGKSSEEDDMDVVDITDDSILHTLNKLDNGDKIQLKTGWDEFNKGVAGSLNTGELTVVEALQHKNKTGFTLALFLQTMLNNDLELKDGKKPLWLWISLEDDVIQIIIKMFVYLYFRKYKKMPLMLEIDNAFISKFVKDEIDATGKRLVVRRIDNTKFTVERYKKLVKGYELAGNRVVVTAVDYLEKAYVNDAKYSTGPNGSGLKNMFTAYRTFIQEENILFITPHQISPEALNIIRNGVSDKEFLKQIVNKNFTQGSRGLPQEFDVEIMIHLCKINGIDYQAVQIGKFKRPDYVDPKDKFMLIPFEQSSKTETKKILAPLMEDCSATNIIIKENGNDHDNTLDL